MLGQEIKRIIRFAELEDISRNANTIYLKTTNNMTYNFTMLFNASEAHQLIEQLNKMAIQQLIHDPDSPVVDHKERHGLLYNLYMVSNKILKAYSLPVHH